MSSHIDLGDGHRLRYLAWKPDRELNPQYDGIPDVERIGAVIDHISKQTGKPCSGGVTFDSDVARRIGYQPGRLWQVESWEPLTISPSVLCSCGDHGFIRNGRWESC